ncbi:Glyco_trans_2-like domain-containing protein [Vibrio owensii]|uniref:glycosyltransferase n=1 Tax=Vibrio owensii TaxID=696485 RepID=UPI002895F5A8|nr:Glyco_trans_2-like domain-containing protein [Vibrio owensii]CAH1554803.1 Glyco_trans_2-like domain-containing protein [Vibrio owensii]
MINIEDITVAISTYESRISQALIVESKFCRLGFKTMIIHQSKNPDSYEQNDSRCKIIKIGSFGVTKSRNVAIKNVTTEYIWFMDDDIDVLEEQVFEFISEMPIEAEVISTRVLNETGKPRKRYPEKGYITAKRRTLGVGTIELIAKVRFLKENKINFPEFMGAGTDLPVGDEAVFVSKILDSKGRLYHCDKSMVIHPDDSSGKNIDLRTIKSKGLMIRIVFGYVKSIFIHLYLANSISSISGLSKYRTFCLLLSGSLFKED